MSQPRTSEPEDAAAETGAAALFMARLLQPAPPPQIEPQPHTYISPSLTVSHSADEGPGVASPRIPMVTALLLAFGLVVAAAVSSMTHSGTADTAAIAQGQVQAGETASTLGARISLHLDVVSRLADSLSRQLARGTPPSRDELNPQVRDTLASVPDFVGGAVTFEPNALDGRDAEFAGQAPLYDATGRFMPYWSRKAMGSTEFTAEPIVFQDAPGANDWYDIPKKTGKVLLTEPYLYPVNGEQVLMASLVAPIVVDGVFKGAVSADYPLDRLSRRIAQVVPPMGGQMMLVSNGGVYATHPDDRRLGQRATELPPEALQAIRQGRTDQFVDRDGHIHLLQPVVIHPDVPPWSLIIDFPLNASR
ncbi:cache domain-containing protein [Amphibiibacter pelophylacis]|uniref:Cache domain-containing protein n=1 Tax=Amphibiibacter pelophylacis TaxID=1799477 RepID=A0ACC6NZ13_9BURK